MVKTMHNDFGTRTKREEFRYHYKGSELLPYAERAYLRYLKAEIEARERAAAILTDMAIKQNDPELDRCRKDIENYGKIREQWPSGSTSSGESLSESSHWSWGT